MLARILTKFGVQKVNDSSFEFCEFQVNIAIITHPSRSHFFKCQRGLTG